MQSFQTLTLFILIAAPLLAARGEAIRTESGLLAGSAGDGSLTVFKGIPYAAAPVGARRWKAPEPPLKWAGVRTAGQFGASCIQTLAEEKKPWTHEFMAHGEISEDCLFLNIWTPATSAAERRPVLVYLHGGANVEGSGSVAVYSGEGLARKGIVMVTVNYRLGTFGFFTHLELSKESANHVSGNYALLDQIAALQWIRRNIAAFGGDPQRVTVDGQSAGASDIALLIASPLAKGLFQRAIMESGGAPGNNALPNLADAEKRGVKFAQAKGAGSLAQLRSLSWKSIVAPLPSRETVRFGPVIDGFVVPGLQQDVFRAGKENDVATLTGINADENGASPHPTVTADQFHAAATRYGALAAEFLQAYPVSSDSEAALRSNEAARDRQRVAQLDWAAARSVGSKTDTYLYFYNHVLPGPDSAHYGAFHSSEIPYVLNTLDQSDRPFTPEDRKVAETLSSYWVNFAANADPNGPGLAHWPSVREEPRMVMELGDHNGAIPAASTEAKFKLILKLIALSNPSH